MGQYLAIGITTKLHIRKKEAESAFDSLQTAIDYVEENFAPSDVYDKTEEHEGYVTFSIKDEILENGLVDFLTDFYTARMTSEDEFKDRDRILEKLKEAKNAADIMDFARNGYCYHFREDEYWEKLFIKCGTWGNSLYASVDGIDLSLDGKIVMECYDTLFKFFTNVLQEKFKKHPISKALRVTLMG